MQRESAVRKYLGDAVRRIDCQLRTIATALRMGGDNDAACHYRVYAEREIIRLETDRKEIREFLASNAEMTK